MKKLISSLLLFVSLCSCSGAYAGIDNYQYQITKAKTDAISAAASDATTKASNAQSAAISAAASDATTKANNAQSAAISAAASDATTKANNAQSAAQAYANGTSSQLIGGYQRLPSGILLQWGSTGSIATNSTVAPVFPIAFTSCWHVFLTPNDLLNNNQSLGFSATGLTTTGFTAKFYSTDALPRSFRYLAIGN